MTYPAEAVKRAPPASLSDWARAIRVHQWIKNVLVFTPILTSHRFSDGPVLKSGLFGFLAMSLAASAAYLINDVIDIEADRRHDSKRRRPVASGAIPIKAAIAAAALLLILAAIACLPLPRIAPLFLLGYFAATALYSAYLKKLLIADVVTLSLFYTARVLFGGVITGIEISVWTLAFSVFTFFALAAAKRINDLARAPSNREQPVDGRAYRAADRGPLVSQAMAAANVAVLVLIFYLNSPQVAILYRKPEFLWGMCPFFIYWFNRMITLANRGALPDDPILFAVQDKTSYAVLAALALIAILAN